VRHERRGGGRVFDRGIAVGDASVVFADTRAKPMSPAVRSLSTDKPLPASAPAPKGLSSP